MKNINQICRKCNSKIIIDKIKSVKNDTYNSINTQKINICKTCINKKKNLMIELKINNYKIKPMINEHLKYTTYQNNINLLSYPQINLG